MLFYSGDPRSWANRSKLAPLGGTYWIIVPLMKAQKWPMPAASEREQLLLILRSTRALWKLALEHGSRGKRHLGPNEKLNTMYSSLLAQDLSLLSFEWFENPLSSWGQSPRLRCTLPSFPCLAGNKSRGSDFLSTVHPSLGFSHRERPASCLVATSFL